MRHMKQIVILLILIMIFSPMHSISADKIQKEDKWEYLDEKNNKLINETAIDIIQLKAQWGDYLATAVVDTKRGYQFPYDLNLNVQGNLYLYDLQFNLLTDDNGILYLSQEGGLPLWVDRIFTGSVVLSISNATWNYQKSFDINEIPLWKLEGTPSAAFATSETTSYAITTNFDIDAENNFAYKQWHVISTNDPMSKKTRNYTITQGDYMLNGFDDDLSFSFIKSGSEFSWGVRFNETHEDGYIVNSHSLSLSSLNGEGIQLIWNEDEKLPEIVTQTEPVKLVQGLELNEISYERVTYILSSGLIFQTEDESPLIFIIPSLVLLVFYRSYKKKHY